MTNRNMFRFAVICAAMHWAGCARPLSAPPADPLERVSPASLLASGTFYLRSGDAVRAEQYFVAALSRGATYEEVLPGLVESCLSSWRVSAAIDYLFPYCQSRPNDAAANTLLARLREILGEDDDSDSALLRPELQDPK